ncbi:Xenotropic and polytropic retrovirus receptor 1 [Homalodisca vitripennis]|nr:Xenotropic and polytropic retrovirus receptor 1 [Homalodisca vitripennis]
MATPVLTKNITEIFVEKLGYHKFYGVPKILTDDHKKQRFAALLNFLEDYDEQSWRFVWNFFRLENEHLNNCGKFRAVRDISVAPLDSSDQTQILRMMDDPDGVTNRHKKKAAVAAVGLKKRVLGGAGGGDHLLTVENNESTDDPDT